MIYQKTFFFSRFTKGSYSLGYTEKSGKKFFGDFYRLLEKVIDAFSVNVRLRNLNLKGLPISRALKLLPESISLTHRVFGALFWHKQIKNHFNTNVLNMRPYSQSAIQTYN